MKYFTGIIFLICLLSFGCKPLKYKNTKGASNNPTKSQKASARPVHWSYQGESGPSAWGNLSPVYSLCSEGKNQSPVNIRQSDVKKGVHWKVNYKKSSLKIAHNEHMDDILDNGHTIQVTVDEGSTFHLNGKDYHLKQFHFHTPSEHTIDGKQFPMEVHFVHQSNAGELAVIAFFAVEGKENPNFKKILDNLPSHKGVTKHLSKVNLALQFQLPEKQEAYHYQGSLTTPPCSENVEWLIFKHHISASKNQLQEFTEKLGKNHRPIQNLNQRSIKLDALSGKIEN